MQIHANRRENPIGTRPANPSYPIDRLHKDPIEWVRAALVNAAYAAVLGVGAGVLVGSAGKKGGLGVAVAAVAVLGGAEMGVRLATKIGVITIGTAMVFGGKPPFSALIAGVVAGMGIDLILNHLRPGYADRRNIGNGMAAGAVVAILGGIAGIPPTYLTTLSTFAFVGGAAAGVSTLINS